MTVTSPIPPQPPRRRQPVRRAAAPSRRSRRTSPTTPRDERAAYEAAVAAYEDFSDRNAELVRKGKATPEAREFYQEATAGWQSYWARLQQFDSRDIRVVGRADVLRVRPASIELDDGGGQVDLRVCSTSEGVRVLQSGSPMPQPSPKPTITKVSMVQLPDESSWRILSDRAGGPC